DAFADSVRHEAGEEVVERRVTPAEDVRVKRRSLALRELLFEKGAPRAILAEALAGSLEDARSLAVTEHHVVRYATPFT
ncbi:MAG TPA: hypothetical protein VNM91_04595, partial [Dehalococcoidia bacterium]|nr:hypothetical protein [Dehalococcoidia bacterium]